MSRKRPLTGFDVDKDSLVDELRTLADAFEDGDAYVQAVESVESVESEGDAIQSLTVEFLPTNKYEGELRFDYDE